MKKFICNPLNLEYRYQLKKGTGYEAVFRETGDPTVILFKDKYYLFPSVSGGFWYSDDLYDWKFRETPELPLFDYAPDIHEIGGKMIFSSSNNSRPCSFYASSDPVNEPFTVISSPFPFWDPAIFKDDDGRIYFYWGCSNTDPIWGIEIDPATMMPISEKLALMAENEAEHGWERRWENQRVEKPQHDPEEELPWVYGMKPHIEGAFMNKYNGKYYLQYSAPGTEYDIYSDGVYVSDKPLGPFEYQEHNPFSSKPGGFINGAGHGSTFKDKFDNWWHIATMVISKNEMFERRIGLFPCDFNDHGTMYCNQNFADHPFILPTEKRKDMDKIAPEMMLLSYKSQTEASSYQEGYEPEKAADEQIRTWWAAETTGQNEWIKMDLNEIHDVQAIQLNFADHKIPMPEGWEKDATDITTMEKRKILVQPQRTNYLLEGSENGSDWFTLKEQNDPTVDFPHDFISFENPISIRYIKVSRIQLPFNAVPAVSAIRIFGNGTGPAPSQVTGINVKRTDERMNILLKWQPVPEADGYNIRYGLEKDKLYSSWQIFEKPELDLSLINKSPGYYISIDSFNKNGVTPGEVFYVE